jgi:hypothetical protein
MKWRGNGHPGTGLIYEINKDEDDDEESVFKCLWDMPRWNCIQWRERELVVINESR